MAITVSNQPSYPNAAYTKLLYSIGSTQSGEPQFQYVMDIKQGGATLARIRQYPNPNGIGIFDPSRIFTDYISYDQNWKTSSPATPVTSYQQFDVLFGEEYGTSLSSSITLYDGNGNPGNPAVNPGTAQVIGAVVDPNNGYSFNWQPQTILTDRPFSGSTSTLTYDEYETISLYVTSSTTVTVVYSPGSTSTYNLTSGFYTIPIGGANIGGQQAWNTAVVSINGTEYTYVKSDNCFYDRVRFAFINKYGFWDYYGVNLPQKKTTTTTRQGLTRPIVNYSGVVAAYNPSRRGEDWYNIQYQDSFVAVTDWLDQVQAQWLQQIFESPSVYIQQGSDFLPVVITNGEYIHNINKRGQKTFQYNIEYRLSNSRPGR